MLALHARHAPVKMSVLRKPHPTAATLVRAPCAEGTGYNDSSNDGALGGNTTSGTTGSGTGHQQHSHGLASFIPGTAANKEKKLSPSCARAFPPASLVLAADSWLGGKRRAILVHISQAESLQQDALPADCFPKDKNKNYNTLLPHASTVCCKTMRLIAGLCCRRRNRQAFESMHRAMRLKPS